MAVYLNQSLFLLMTWFEGLFVHLFTLYLSFGVIVRYVYVRSGRIVLGDDVEDEHARIFFRAAGTGLTMVQKMTIAFCR